MFGRLWSHFWITVLTLKYIFSTLKKPGYASFII